MGEMSWDTLCALDSLLVIEVLKLHDLASIADESGGYTILQYPRFHGLVLTCSTMYTVRMELEEVPFWIRCGSGFLYCSP